MKRRAFVAGILCLTVAAGPAAAQGFADRVLRQLRAQGYAEVEVTRTLLGRVRVFARKGNETREIIFNPRTGEILRDYWHRTGGSGSSGRQDGSAPDLIDPDDDDDDDDDDSGSDDNSGHSGGDDGDDSGDD